MANYEKDWIEEIRIRGTEAVDRIKELVGEGNIRKIVLKKENNEILFELPLTAGVLAGGAVTLMAPVIAAIGAAAAFLAHVKVEIHREKDSDNTENHSAVATDSDGHSDSDENLND